MATQSAADRRTFGLDEGALVVKGRGAALVYTERDSLSGIYRSPPNTTNCLRRTDDGWIETQSNGLELHYEQAAPGELSELLRIQTPGGDRWTLTRDAGAVESIQDPAGRLTTYAYPNTLQTQITDALGRITTLAKDASGCITSVEQPLGERTTMRIASSPASTHSATPAPKSRSPPERKKLSPQ